MELTEIIIILINIATFLILADNTYTKIRYWHVKKKAYKFIINCGGGRSIMYNQAWRDLKYAMDINNHGMIKEIVGLIDKTEYRRHLYTINFKYGAKE